MEADHHQLCGDLRRTEYCGSGHVRLVVYAAISHCEQHLSLRDGSVFGFDDCLQRQSPDAVRRLLHHGGLAGDSQLAGEVEPVFEQSVFVEMLGSRFAARSLYGTLAEVAVCDLCYCELDLSLGGDVRHSLVPGRFPWTQTENPQPDAGLLLAGIAVYLADLPVSKKHSSTGAFA